FLRCGACKSPYCSPACQREDFSEHKVQCKTIRETAELAARFEVSVDDEMQYLVGELPQVSLGDPTARVKSPLKSMTESSDTLPQRAERSDPLPQRAERSDTLSQRAERSDPPPSTRGGPEKYMSAKMTRVSLPLQKKCQVKIIDLSSPSDLCVIFPDSVPQLVKLIQDMKEYYSGTTNIGPGAYVPSVGEVCAVQYAVDSGWYRAMVEEITLNGQVRVRYQDYGNVEERPVMYTRKLLPEFTQLPLQGMRCCIANVAPVQGSDWSDHVTSELKTVVDSLGGKFDVVCEQVVNGISHIQLLTEEGGNVGEALIYQNMARQSSEEVLYDAALATSSAETEQNMARQSSEEVYAAAMATSSVETEQNMARQSPEVPYAAQKTTLSVESEQWGQSPN
ncbi:tudor domain-containing protein 1-like, partial [Lingula anatina]|uniref:Tudor domain-containing protein 1-like n=1 Tax=Lingula anatina TaxID=7574 RepID=A0A2R2MMR1_LINAN